MKRWPKCACGNKSVVRTETTVTFRTDTVAPINQYKSYFCISCLRKISEATVDVVVPQVKVSKDWLMARLRALDTDTVDVRDYLRGKESKGVE